MPRTLVLTSHNAIQNWVSNRNGHPAIVSRRDSTGQLRPALRLNFSRGATQRPSLRDEISMSPCSWAAWLAEFDRQWAAIEVPDTDDDDIRPYDISFVEKPTRH